MNLDEDILNIVLNHYINSRDFNGILAFNLAKPKKLKRSNLKTILKDMVIEEKITLTFESTSENPYIKRLPDLSVEDQVLKLESEPLEEICIYPSSNVLSSVDIRKYDDSPFSKMLLLGNYQLKPIFFDPIVLETYFQDPRYIIWNNDYSGSISISDSFYSSEGVLEKDEISLQSFGIGYTIRENEKVIVGLLRYLSDLSPEHQQVWNSYIKSDRCRVEDDYLANISGKWITHVSIYNAFIEELYHINEISMLMGREPLFRETFKDSRPRHFASFLRPTFKNYNDFIHLLDKMLSDNINKKFFRNDIPLETETERKDEKVIVSQRGTIALLDEWLRTAIKVQDGTVYSTIIDPIRKVRNERQKPAHTIQEDKYDKIYFTKQSELIESAYVSIRTIRLLLMNHPFARNYEVPDWLYEGRIKTY